MEGVRDLLPFEPSEEELEADEMDVKSLLKAIDEAKTEPSPTCPNAEKHEFKAVTHLDGRDSFTWIYRCEHCQECVKKTKKRTGMDRKFWR